MFYGLKYTWVYYLRALKMCKKRRRRRSSRSSKSFISPFFLLVLSRLFYRHIIKSQCVCLSVCLSFSHVYVCTDRRYSMYVRTDVFQSKLLLTKYLNKIYNSDRACLRRNFTAARMQERREKKSKMVEKERKKKYCVSRLWSIWQSVTFSPLFFLLFSFFL